MIPLAQRCLLNDAYSSLGFTHCESDWSIYVRKTPSAITISATSVDNLLIASNTKQESDLAASQIKQKFAVTDSGDTEWLLGCRIRRWRDCRLLTIDQEQYTIQILTNFHMEHCNSIKTPCPPQRLTSAMCPTTDEERNAAALPPYCALVENAYTSRTACNQTYPSLYGNLPDSCPTTAKNTSMQQNTSSATFKEPAAEASPTETPQTLTQSLHHSQTQTGPCPTIANQSWAS